MSGSRRACAVLLTVVVAIANFSACSSSGGTTATTATSNPNAWATSDPATRATNEQVAPTSVLGVDQVDDGINATETAGSKTVSAAAAAAAAFGTAAPSTPNPAIQSARDVENAIPASEYSLTALAATLPNDPVALYAFVRDRIGTDVYAGSMRGPLGAWLARAANPADKARLLAWLLSSKGIASRFERGTLSDAECAQIAQAAAAAKRAVVVPKDGDFARYTTARANAGAAFATWAIAKLQAAGVTLGGAAIDATKVPRTHYWIRVYQNGKQIDLDPTLASSQEGQHLGTTDGSFKESATFPDGDTMHVRVRLVATRAGAQAILAESTGAVADVAFEPLMVGIAPKKGDPTTLTTAVIFGSKSTDGKPIATDAASLPDSLVLQVDRASGDGTTTTIRRTIFDRSKSAGDPAQAMTGLHTIVLAPGAAPLFFVHEILRDARALTENAAAKAAGASAPFSGLYPAKLAAYFLRDDVLAAALGDRNGLRLFRDRPDMAMVHTTVAGGSGATAQLRTMLDIADNGMNAVGSASAVASANVARGWGDTWIEKDLMGAGATGAMTAWLAQKTTAAYTVQRQQRDDLAPGDAAIVAAGGAQWWDVDPATASVVGRVPGGWGDALPEYAEIIRLIQEEYEVYEVYGTAKECHEGGAECAEKICELVISGGLYIHSLGEATIAAGALAAEIIFGKAVGLGCGALGPGEGGGGEPGGGGGEPGGNGGAPPNNSCSDMCTPEDPNSSDGTGP